MSIHPVFGLTFPPIELTQIMRLNSIQDLLDFFLTFLLDFLIIEIEICVNDLITKNAHKQVN